ncbi:MAG: (2Fe-2S)-binding protein [Deltaproteobacteria bacterium]|nr:(2Fe-2S)-binding protein [Deltaproteobacteria bacterium]
MIVCSCYGVSDVAVRKAVEDGARTPELVAARCCAGNSCGACLEMLEQLIQETVVSPTSSGDTCRARAHRIKRVA